MGSRPSGRIPIRPFEKGRIMLYPSASVPPSGGGRVVRWCGVNCQCRGVLLILIKVGQVPTALAVGAGVGCFGHFFSRLSFLFSFSLSLGDGSIWTKILSQRAIKTKTTNQPTLHPSVRPSVNFFVSV